ncbi:MFS transporter [Dactylonectria estremocensis]|uniref:MFS transporter n=1 Tax=Dactylonectria estremocensis TaxID=1079267 RepID=A0A9P9EV36_9HYPO|nr:MFS transporter [Dactylonectria estremocensis]
MPESQRQKASVHWRWLAACALASICPFQYGLDQGVIGGLQAMPGFLQVFGHEAPDSPLGYNLSYVRQQLLTSLMVVGVFVSSAAAGAIAKFAGRKMSIWVGVLTCVVSIVIMMATTSIGALYFARLLIGVSNGLFVTFGLLYLQECAPPEYRGVAVGISQVWQSLGTLIGIIADNFTATLDGRQSYIIPLSIIYIVPLILAIGLFFIPESPRWYLLRNETEKARNALAWLRTDDERVNEEITEMVSAIEAERALSKGTAVLDMFRLPVDRRRTMLAIGALSLQAACGIVFIISYSTYFFEMAQTGSPFENSCILLGVATAAVIINCTIIRKYGRRRVLLTAGLIVCGIAQLIPAIVYDKRGPGPTTGKVLVAFTVIYVVGYNGMISTYSWVSAGELPSQRLRSSTFGLATSISFLGAWLTTFTAPYFINPDALNWGPKYGYIWAPSCFIGALWTLLYLPETQNRTLEEITEMFEARVPARKFRTYRCVGSIGAVAKEKHNDKTRVIHNEYVAEHQ